ncbi:twin-arginine translocation signal domain-containing protein [Paramixta manurensis]|uniref:Twin-arginine translocation signal domain-containing protein n=1 Tax=Paramixta manurensis TaxID=2740817 RepID=A0A6M8UF45_9GAMM|nr:twin-arginine translocation signal domain-containing protein [Erwiniaceae bacterium PD-1]
MQPDFNRRLLLTAAAGTAAVAGFNSSPLFAAAHSAGAPLSRDMLYSTSPQATALQGEAADRVAIRALIDAWAHYADRRLAEKQAALFTENGGYSIYNAEPAHSQPVSSRHGRAQIVAALATLNQFVHTTHFNGQSAIAIKGDRAIGESYCLAHQLHEVNGQRTLQLLSIRYYDDFVRVNGQWLFAERQLIIDWSDTRPSAES